MELRSWEIGIINEVKRYSVLYLKVHNVSRKGETHLMFLLLESIASYVIYVFLNKDKLFHLPITHPLLKLQSGLLRKKST